MKILFISFFVPYPPTAGHLQRNFNLIREIAKENEIYLLSFTQRVLLPTEKALQDSLDALKPYCKLIKVYKIPSDYSQLRRLGVLFFNLFSTKPFSVWKFSSPQMKKDIAELIQTDSFDLVHVDTVDIAQFADYAPGLPKVLNHHNVESKLLTRRGKNTGNPLAKLYLLIQGYKLGQYEKNKIVQVDMNLAVSEIDQADFQKSAPDARFVIIENGTDIEYFKPSDKPGTKSLIFAGGMSWYPNADAMVHLCSDIYPLIKKEIPEIKCNIIGSHPPGRLLSLAKLDESIKIHGYVNDVREYLAEAGVYVVPIRVGGGTRLKILDAMAAGKAVVSTSVGCEGLKVTPDENILIGDTPESFARQVVRLINDNDLKKKLEVNGRKLVEEEYSWAKIGRQLNDVYKSVVSQKKK